jgi:hypothetical protein
MVIELGDIASWPAAAVVHVDTWIERLDGKGWAYASADAEDTLRAIFAGHRIRGYHCTRLLDHEVDTIKVGGMLPLTKARLRERIVRAYDAGAFASSVRDHLLAIAEQPTYGREGITCYFLPLAYLTSSLGRQGLPYYLARWGGERMNTAADRDVQALLATIGRPSIVVAAFDVVGQRAENRMLSLLEVCMAIRNGERDAAAELQALVPVMPEAIWHPGDPEYDALGDLSQS